jgi:hypothetical protein
MRPGPTGGPRLGDRAEPRLAAAFGQSAPHASSAIGSAQAPGSQDERRGTERAGRRGHPQAITSSAKYASQLVERARECPAREQEEIAANHISPESLERLRRFEAAIAATVHRYLALRVGPDYEARSNVIADLSMYLQFLLEMHSEFRGAPGYAFDGVVEDEITVRKGYRLDVRCLMCWLSDNARTNYVDVFGASMRVAKNADALETYVLRFGRRGHESRRIPYGATRELKRELEQAGTWEWAYVFKKEDILA